MGQSWVTGDTKRSNPWGKCGLSHESTLDSPEKIKRHSSCSCCGTGQREARMLRRKKARSGSRGEVLGRCLGRQEETEEGQEAIEKLRKVLEREKEA